MIRNALELEVRNLLRSPLRLLVLLLVLGAGVIVLFQGQQEVERWKEAIATGEAAQEESLAEALGYFESGEAGPADRPWVDLNQPHWQDYYAATRISREPVSLAGIAFASSEAGAVTVRLNRFADASLEQGNKIENPALAATGGLDLVTVLALLLPLLILALGVEVGGYERSAGMMPLVRVQSGRDRSWIWARSIAVGIIVALVGLLLCTCAVLFAGVGVSAGSVAGICLLVVGYVAVWTALLGIVAQMSRNPSHGAVALGAAWIVLCVLVPAIGVERSAALAADDFALDLTVEARDAGGEIAKLDTSTLYAALFERFPGLEGKEPGEGGSPGRVATDGMQTIALEERMELRDEQAEAYGQLVNRMSFLSPTVAFTYALERLAGRGPEAARTFRHSVAEAAATRMESAISTTWKGEPLGVDDFEALVAASPTRVAPPASNWWREFALLFGWTLSLLVGGMLLARRWSG